LVAADDFVAVNGGQELAAVVDAPVAGP